MRFLLYLGGYLRDFDIYLGRTYPLSDTRLDVGDFILCQHYPGVVGAAERVTTECTESVSARYVVILKNDTTPLQLCEVQVYTAIGIKLLTVTYVNILQTVFKDIRVCYLWS